MPRDVTNMPYPSNAPFAQERRERPNERGESADNAHLDPTLKLDNMLLEEFNYASTTAYQAMEDRARMFNLYLLLIGVLGSGLAAIYQLGGGLRSFTPELAMGLLAIAGIMGVAFFVKIIRLRQAWRESAEAMNEIKEYYIKEFSALNPNVEKAFKWRLNSLPTGEKPGSVTFVICATIAFLGGLCFAGAAFMAAQQWVVPLIGDFTQPPPSVPVVPISFAAAVIAFLLTSLILGFYYHHALNRKREDKAIRDVAATVGSPDTPPSHV